MTTSRIYAYRRPARLVSHKPFAAESYSITPSCIWQVFFRKKNEFSFLFSLFCGIAFFLCKMHNPIPFYGWKTPLPRCRNGSMAVFGVFIPIYKREPSFCHRPTMPKGGFPYFFFNCSARPSRGVMYTVVYTSYSTMPGLAPLAFQMFFTSVVSTATLAPVPAL